MVISVFCESPRERKLCKWASNCGLEEMPYKKSVFNFPLTSQNTQQISTSNQNINILLDFKCPLTALHIVSAWPLPGILIDSRQKYKERPHTVTLSSSFPHWPPSFTMESLHYMECSFSKTIHILPPNGSWETQMCSSLLEEKLGGKSKQALRITSQVPRAPEEWGGEV